MQKHCVKQDIKIYESPSFKRTLTPTEGRQTSK